MSESNTQSEYEVTAFKHSDSATSGEMAEVYSVEADNKRAAEDKVKEKPGVIRVDPSMTIEFERGENGARVY